MTQTPKKRSIRFGTSGAPLVGAALIVLLIVAAAAGSALAAAPAYFGGYKSLARAYSTLSTSAHKGLACSACHADSRGAVVYRVALVGEFYRGLLRKPDTPAFVRLGRPSAMACLVCHKGDWSDDARKTGRVPHPAHLRVATEKRDCVVCHKWIGHEEAYMEKHKAMPFSSVCASFECHVGTKPAGECASCHHLLASSKGTWSETHPATVRANGPNGCLEKCHSADQCRACHTTGKEPDFGPSVADRGVSGIEASHVAADWMSRHGTLALSSPEKCLVCHVSEGECQDCHAKRPAFHGPQATWIGSHKNMAEDKRRCLACHKMEWCEACHKQFKEMR